MKPTLEHLKSYLKRFSALFQTKNSSYALHNSEYILPGKIDNERAFIKKMLADKAYDNADNKISRLLARYPDRDLVVDIGSGNGWYSAYLSQFFKKVIGIEPSSAAIALAKSIHPADKYPNIEWKQGFAEEALNILPLPTTSTLFVTGCVLSHMRDKEVAAICEIINSRAKKGSALSFSECWGEESHKHMWHVRTKEWWQARLSNWELDFHGGMVEDIPGRFKGFHGIKID